MCFVENILETAISVDIWENHLKRERIRKLRDLFSCPLSMCSTVLEKFKNISNQQKKNYFTIRPENIEIFMMSNVFFYNNNSFIHLCRKIVFLKLDSKIKIFSLIQFWKIDILLLFFFSKKQL
jgi:hypothetical protein